MTRFNQIGYLYVENTMVETTRPVFSGQPAVFYNGFIDSR
ncbi:hypothetical protein BMS3Abin12_00242 [bacterium BMS3Abin12]|nr:hypothetical protein BMS3Abin12_00242 [bacterium BMS3Abin12]GBE49692.1 hypothetical protein BMS3Bbin13_00614 [bacterium BMS3Bbin13]